jgi:hypothetical protein
MIADPQTITEETSLDETGIDGTKAHQTALVIQGEEIVGIVSRANLVPALASLAPGTKTVFPATPAFESASNGN